jgi:ribosomal protein S18 acetylase RimI-like enzyme
MTLPHTVLAAVPSQTGVESHPLDNVIWHALSGRQIHFSLGDDRARRYTADVAPFAAIRDFSPASFASLLPLVPRGDRVGMFTVTPVPQTEHFEILVAKTAHQMIATRVAGPMRRRGVERLDDSSVPEMLTLVGESQPGPFAARTNQLGDYVGIRVDGQLIAMTGERMKIAGFTEISAVCTHPDHRRHGYAHDLVSAVTQAVLDRGERPFLHVFSYNLPAIALYERLGYTIRRTMHVTVLAAKS